MDYKLKNVNGVIFQTKDHYIKEDINIIPESESLTITKNGTYVPTNGVFFSNITVNITPPKMWPPEVRDNGATVYFKKDRAQGYGSFPLTYVVNGTEIVGSEIAKSDYYDTGDVLVRARSKGFLDSDPVIAGNWTTPVGPDPEPDPPPKPCFTGDTLITLANGATKYAKDITYDDELLVWNFDEGKYDKAKPIWIANPETIHSIIHMYFEDGTDFKAVNIRGRAHRLYDSTNNYFNYGNQLLDSYVLKEDGSSVKMTKCIIEDYEDKDYNIITDYHLNLYANHLLTSTGLSNIYPIKDMKYIKEDRPWIPKGTFGDISDEWYYGLRLGEQVKYTQERLNEKIRLLKERQLPKRK